LWSLLLVLVINPISILTIGFRLSFAAVATIIYIGSGRVKQNLSTLYRLWKMQFTVTLALLPFSLLFFQQFSYITIVANLIAMPRVYLVVAPLSLFGALLLRYY
jgi:competence protein ComEC